ncbi:MAG: HetP family heterocyst commitment protein [Cylindrospermopsis raciborskii KL1]|jgi:hypothetical protein|uniref:HetP family heterocyst commitment protein n=1 Tax=Cylindrospermopsis raciborskii TaxID=77022 RepID=UPI001A328D76|nr:HetP family heterocyst commitment protein [Cylindrospermopsis raciborskii]MBG0742308.1 HetP family heterocyst commitment protein [Cylindrospermopsis raciborskii KL1]
MNYSTSSTSNFESPITPEELNQILTAISNGRYSWACVLILRSMGYNPLHYIPQRTYSRIAKENNPVVTTAVSTPQEALETINSHS